MTTRKKMIIIRKTRMITTGTPGKAPFPRASLQAEPGMPKSKMRKLILMGIPKRRKMNF